MIAVGAFLPLPPLLRTALLGLGNCGFHVGGGTRVLRERGKRAAMLGVFVAPGSVGLVLGTLWPGLRTWLALGLLFCGVLILLDQEVERTVGEFAPATASGKRLWGAVGTVADRGSTELWGICCGDSLENDGVFNGVVGPCGVWRKDCRRVIGRPSGCPTVDNALAACCCGALGIFLSMDGPLPFGAVSAEPYHACDLVAAVSGYA